MEHIAVAVDFSEPSRRALAEALRLARVHGARLHVVHVIDTRVAESLVRYFGQRGTTEISPEDLQRHVVERVERFLDEAEVAAGEAEVAVVTGHPFKDLRDWFARTGVDLAVIGGRGWSETRGHLGSLASQLVRHVPLDMLIVRDKQPGPYRRIVACADFTDQSHQALATAASIAGKDRAEVVVLHVYDPPWAYSMQYGPPIPTPEMEPDFQHEYAMGIRGELEDFVAASRLAGLDLSVRPELRENTSSGHGIASFVRDEEADLVVIASHGRHNLGDWIFGTTTEHVITHSSCSVYVVRTAE